MASMRQLVIPGAGPILQTLGLIKELCSKMVETRPVCDRLHFCLQSLLGEIELMENKGRKLSTESVDKIASVVTDFLRFLEKHADQKLIFRVVKFRTMVDKLRSLSENISELYVALLDVAAVEQWEQDGDLLEKMLNATIEDDRLLFREFQSPRAQLEVLLTFKYEMEKHSDQHQERDLVRMQKVTEKLLTSSRVTPTELPGWYLPEYEVEFEAEPFSKGSFGSVHRGVWNDVNVVVKCVCAGDMAIDSRLAQRIHKEVDVLHQMDHPNVVKLLAASNVSSTPFLVYEDAVNGDLGSFLSCSDENKQHMWQLLYEAAIGLDHIHKKGVIHGHLKLSNILVGAGDLAQLSDFGLNALRSIVNPSGSGSSGSDLRWRAPECLKRRPTAASDVYSFAMCMIEAALGEPPFAFLGDDDVRDSLKNGEIPEQPDDMNDEVWELVVAMTNSDPTQRVGLNHVIDRLSTFAGNDSSGSVQDTKTYCSSCLSFVFDLRNCCAQYGNADRSRTSVEAPAEPDFSENNSETTEHSTVPQLVASIRTGTASQQEDAVLELFQLSIFDDQHQLINDGDVISALTDLVMNGQTHFAKVCAFGCLGWCTELDSTLSERQFEALRGLVRPGRAQECNALMSSLSNDSDQDLLKTVVYCTCIAEANGRKELRNAGVVTPLVQLLKHDNATVAIWTMDALGNLASDDEIKDLIVAKGAIPLLLKTLRRGTDFQRGFAAYVLGQLATNNENNSGVMVDRGAIPNLISLLTTSANVPKNFAAYSLGCIAANDDSYGIAIAEGNGIVRLVHLLRTGTNVQKAHVATALGWLANQEANRIAITQEGAIGDLVALVRSGTDEQKENAAFALSFFATDEVSSVAMVNERVIPSLVALLRSGTEEQKEHAACTLGNLVGSRDNCLKMARQEAAEPLVNLLRTGSNLQKGLAAYTLGCLGTMSIESRTAIASDEVIELLVELIRDGTGEEKDQAMFGL